MNNKIIKIKNAKSYINNAILDIIIAKINYKTYKEVKGEWKCNIDTHFLKP